ncbi:cytochrome P450 [Tothia fuscella]|uniref:Cytochrome P450 n=1 Tax=Tothia fuscella TaxID=1048955 RepID=A0A9P4P481_9PEZI|nr:cytochrome P450 [Tothia fuscella]
MALTTAAVVFSIIAAIVTYVVWNVLKQLYLPDSSKPHVVFHWLPLIGSTVYYGMDPYKFFFECREKYGDCFTFVLLGSPTTVFLGTKGNEFILNGKLKDLNAEEVYGPLTKPVFGKGVVYDCLNSKLMDQKRLLGLGLNGDALKSYVPLFVKEVEDFICKSPVFKSTGGVCDISSIMAEITIYTAAGSLQGKELRDKLDGEVSLLYRDLDDGFAPINFVLPWLPIPRNRRRDRAQKKMAEFYLNVVRGRRKRDRTTKEQDMLDILMSSRYRSGEPIPDSEVACLMIALLMGGQHNTSSTGSWIMLRLAHDPPLIEELLQEQLTVLGVSKASDLPPLTYDHMQNLKLHNQMVRETLRLHSPIHSVMRKVKTPMPVEGTDWVIPPSHTLLAAPGFLGRTEENFPNPQVWDPHRWDDPNAGLPQNAQRDSKEDDETIDYGYGAVSLKSIKSPYLPFGGGRHRCVAEKYAYTQLCAILATMVRLLEWEQVDMSKEVPPTDYSSMFSRPVHPAETRWKHRGV